MTLMPWLRLDKLARKSQSISANQEIIPISEELFQVHARICQGLQNFYKQLSTFCFKLGEVSEGVVKISPNVSHQHYLYY